MQRVAILTTGLAAAAMISSCSVSNPFATPIQQPATTTARPATAATRTEAPWFSTLQARRTQRERERRAVPTSTPSIRTTTPYLVGELNRGIWVSEADGSHREWVLPPDPDSYTVPAFALSPDGMFLALAHTPSPDSKSSSDYALMVFELPSTSPAFTINLFEQQQLDYITLHYPPSSPDSPIEESDFYQRAQVVEAIVGRPNGLAWSPDGQHLAFVAAIDGPTADVYVLDLDNPNPRRLSSGNTHAADLRWTPDSTHIVHQAVADFNLGRGGGHDKLDSLWAADPSRGTSTLLVNGAAFPLGWISPDLLLAYLWQPPCPDYSLLVADVPEAAYSILWRGGISIDWTAELDFSLVVPPSRYDTDALDPSFAEHCPAPANVASPIDLTQVASLPVGAFSPAQDTTLLISSKEGQISLNELQPTATVAP